MALQIKKLGKYVGAEITGIDLRQPQDMKIKTAINKALSDHVAIVVRGQNFTPQEYVEAAKVLGDPFPQNFTDYNHPDVEIINIVSNQHRDDEGQRIKRGGNWHTDHTNHECPPKCTVLYAVDVPRHGGNTAICNMQKAYEHLPDYLKEKIEGRETVNVNQGRAAARISPKAVKRENEQKSTPINHPIIRTHPETGRKALYIGSHTERFDGMTDDESKPLLDYLMAHTSRPEFICRVRWEVGTLTMWDNRCCQHYALNDYQGQRRCVHKITVKGDTPF